MIDRLNGQLGWGEMRLGDCACRAPSPLGRARAGLKEVWAAIPGYEGLYEVSTFGQVRGLDRLVEVRAPGRKIHRRKVAGTIIGQSSIDPDGYPRVLLRKGGQQKLVKTHQLVARAFLPHLRNALHKEVAHLDGTRTNSRLDNLKWVSRVENQSHKVLHGTVVRGERHPGTTLTEADVRLIRASGCSCRVLAERFGVSRHSIYGIRSRKRWAHVV